VCAIWRTEAGVLFAHGARIFVEFFEGRLATVSLDILFNPLAPQIFFFFSGFLLFFGCFVDGSHALYRARGRPIAAPAALARICGDGATCWRTAGVLLHIQSCE
jgi:hypothetical protein